MVGSIESTAVVIESELGAAAGQDGLPLPNLAIQERLVESDVMTNSPPVFFPTCRLNPLQKPRSLGLL